MPIRATLLLLAAFGHLFAAGVTLRFQPANPEAGPFPTDALSVSDTAQKTGRRVNLPLPDCTAQPGLCMQLAALNQLDGFQLQPRLRLRFTGRMNPDTLRDGAWFMALENLTEEEYGVNYRGQLIPVNEVIYDPETDTVYAKPDTVLDQHRRYALILTDSLRDAAGDAVEADPAFLACSAALAGNEYCLALSQAVAEAQEKFGPHKVIGASVFTTVSATAWLEKAHVVIEETSPSPRPVEGRSIFRAADIVSLTMNQQVGVNPARFHETTLSLDAALFTGVGRVAFGSFQSPSFLNDRQFITPIPTGTGVPAPTATNRIFYNAYLPASERPASGYPVVIFGHGLGDNRFGGATVISPALSQAGFATIAISAVGHGYGPESTLTVTERSGTTTVLQAGGRGVDLDGNGTIGAFEGCISPAGAALRDCLRQTALDLAQLAHAIEAGIDLDGDGTPDLDASRIYYVGQSLGGLSGTLFNAIEPHTRAAVLNVAGGSVVTLARWSPVLGPVITQLLRELGTLPPGATFNDNYVFSYQPAKINNVPGAIAVQNILELVEWAGATGDPMSYATHLRSSTLPGVPIKPVLFQIARGDFTVPNPANTALIRAANMRESTYLYRHDLARQVATELPANPHTYLTLFLSTEDVTPLASIHGVAVSLATQQQVAGFLKADGAVIPDVNLLTRPLFNRDLFEIPALLPIDLGY